MRTEYWSEHLKESDHSEDLGVNGRIILERILGKERGKCGLDSSGSGYEPVTGSTEYEKAGNFLSS
jgi:hypothetical protein